jgi:hypothetical protein
MSAPRGLRLRPPRGHLSGVGAGLIPDRPRGGRGRWGNIPWAAARKPVATSAKPRKPSGKRLRTLASRSRGDARRCCAGGLQARIPRQRAPSRPIPGLSDALLRVRAQWWQARLRDRLLEPVPTPPTERSSCGATARGHLAWSQCVRRLRPCVRPQRWLEDQSRRSCLRG